MKTTDLIDANESKAKVVNLSSFKRYGAQHEFHGQIETVKCLEDNTILKGILSTNGEGRVLVVDGGGSFNRALMGDNVGALAVENHWKGIVINGCIRDSEGIDELPIGVIALGTTPRRPLKENQGEKDIPIEFAGARFVPGDYIYCDEDGVLISRESLKI